MPWPSRRDQHASASPSLKVVVIAPTRAPHAERRDREAGISSVSCAARHLISRAIPLFLSRFFPSAFCGVDLDARGLELNDRHLAQLTSSAGNLVFEIALRPRSVPVNTLARPVDRLGEVRARHQRHDS